MEKDFKKINYRSLINRKAAITACIFGMLALLIAMFMLVCGFVMLGGFCLDINCQGVTDGVGFWVGFPLLVPALLGIIVLGSRHSMAMKFYLGTNVLVLIFSIVHVIMTYLDNEDYWKEQKDLYSAGKCTMKSFTRCSCDGSSFVDYPYRCDLIPFGSDLNWILFGLGIASVVSTVCGVATGFIGVAISKSHSSK